MRSLVKFLAIRASVWFAFFVLFGNSIESIPESYKRRLVNSLRETFGLIGAPIRLSMRSGRENPYVPKKRLGS